MAVFKYSSVDFLFTAVGLPVFLGDVVLDVLAAVRFYQDGAYFSLGLLLLFLLGSSVLAQVYSWLWYGYDQFQMRTQVETCVSKCSLQLFHFFQLGIYFRHLAVLETAVKTFCHKNADAENYAVYLSHDLSMLRIMETFSESAPQLLLMLTIYLQEGSLDLIKVIKAIGSAIAMAYCVTMYHRSLRSFLPDKKEQTVISSIVYFVWNFFLVSSRLVALVLFASVLPCFIFTHFLCSWMLLFFCAWRSKTCFMESSCGEWLYRSTVALIWYFDWFNVVKGRTRYRTLTYHLFILVDMSVLCGVWCWKMSTDPPQFVVPPPYPTVTVVCVLLVYVLGLILKLLYYKCFHPNVRKEELKGDGTETPMGPDEVDSSVFRSLEEDSPASRSLKVRHQARPAEPCNRRMRKLAENFYS